VRLFRSIAQICNLTVVNPYSLKIDQPTHAAGPLPGGWKIDRTVALGTVLSIEALWKKLGLKKTLADTYKNSRSPAACERAPFAMTPNRLGGSGIQIRGLGPMVGDDLSAVL